MNRSAGFTLVEMLLSVAIIGMLVGLSIPIYQTFVQRNDLDITAQTVVNMLRRAETYARASNTDNAWSVELQSTTITLFQGTTFASRNTAYDETYSLPGSVTPSGLGEVQFTKFTGIPNTTGTVTLTSNTNDTRTITVNAKGMVDY
ncbi:MAG TPA: type II secretion system protein [Candidatus Saccharimonadales bacterium]|nr:type II secretion system protein [Candidatus Saccharimonadales bacterium]